MNLPGFRKNSIYLKMLCVLGVCCAFIFSTRPTRAFALLGPFESWMVSTNGVRDEGDIGGPMDIGNGYRWNVPTVTYGFDKSFIGYFGSNGVAAVEAAIKILNDLPPASQIVLTNYPLTSQRVNFAAESENLIDLKSTTLSLLVEHLGLAQPTRYISLMKQWSPRFLENAFENEGTYGDWAYPDYLVNRNFDPQTLAPSYYVNGTGYSTILQYIGYSQLILPIAFDPNAPTYNAVADILPAYGSSIFINGGYFTGLTRDDVGGLAYLLSTNNIAYENLLEDVSAYDTNSSFVNSALRPGADKITFVPHPQDPNTYAYLTMTNSYFDSYLTNGVVTNQHVKRVIAKPDFLFCLDNKTGTLGFSLYDRTGTSNWINNTTLNGSSEGGPGVIQPQVKITFHKVGHFLDYDFDNVPPDDEVILWGSFDGSTNAPATYPPSSLQTNLFVINMFLTIGNDPKLPRKTPKVFEWSVNNAIGSTSLFQTSTNLINWETVYTATNDGTALSIYVYNPASACRFYRVVP